MSSQHKLRVGDRVLVEQAWEDATGAYHDEQAEILAIREDERVELEFDLGDYNPEEVESIKLDLQLSVFTLEDLQLVERGDPEICHCSAGEAANPRRSGGHVHFSGMDDKGLIYEPARR